MLNQTEHEISQLIITKMLKNNICTALKLSDKAFILLINVKMPTIVGILTFMSRINFMLIVEHEKKFYNLKARRIEN